MIEYVIWFFVIALAVSVGITLAYLFLVFISALYTNYWFENL